VTNSDSVTKNETAAFDAWRTPRACMQNIKRSVTSIDSVAEYLLLTGIGLVIVGGLLVLLGILASFLGGNGKQSRRGAVLMIGPFPIVLADDADTAKILMILASFLILASLCMMILLARV